MAARRRSSADCSSLSPMAYKTGTLLFARISSGSFEVAKILKVDSFHESYHALFENGKKRWVPFADVQKKDLAVVLNVCCLCQRKARSPTKPLLRCITCKLGFHRKCHSPIVNGLDSEEVTRWQCQVCIYTSSPSAYSETIFSTLSEESQPRQLPTAIKSSNDRVVGSNDELHLVSGGKKSSYSLASLTWDENHLTNSENCYCYCGRPGRWDHDMLRCTRCLQWVHRDCISVKTDALVVGDLMYLFVCSNCFRDEFYRRLKVTWKDLAHLVLYNLSREQPDVDFFDFKWDIVPWFRRHWRNFHAGWLKKSQKERERKLLEALDKNPNRFGRSNFPKTGWNLKERKVLTPPDIDLLRFQSPSQLQLEELLRTGCGDLEEKRGRKRSNSLGKVDTNFRSQRRKKQKVDTSEATSTSTDVSQSASVHSPSTSKPIEVRRGLLREMIPAPPSYEGVNHPFKTAIEKEDEIKSIECRSKALLSAVHKLAARFNTSADSLPIDAKNEEQACVPAIRSVPGEQFNFNGLDIANRPKRRKSFIKKKVTNTFLGDHLEDGVEGVTIRYFAPNCMKGRVIGKRTIEGSKQEELLVEWRDSERT